MKFSDGFLENLAARIAAGERVSAEDALRMFESKDILGLGYLADNLRKQRVGDVVTFVGNYHICYSNICINECRYCIFKRKPDDKDAFALTLEEIEELAEESRKHAVPEILMFGGIHPRLGFDFFSEALARVKKRVPEIKILGFSPLEIDNFSQKENKSIDEIFDILQAIGLSAITGGGAEIFSPRIRTQLGCINKISGRRWLQIMEAAHNHGVYSNASMLYGAGETYAERVEHLQAIRDVQDRTGGFTHFLPFAFSNADYPPTTGYDDIKMIAVSRIFLDNFTHIRAYWSHLGLKGAQLALAFGADDLNGLKQKGRIIHSSGGGPSKAVKKEDMINIIRDAGRVPAERNILFELVEVYDPHYSETVPD
jgi:aminodeoxyfutalosine synthase